MYKENPFGNSDGARASLKEIEASFITDFPYGLRISNDPSFLSKRFIVGAKGSGKTVYLRKLQSILKKKLESQSGVIYVDEKINGTLNCTDLVIRFCDLFKQEMLSEKWNEIWKLTIFISVAHKFLFDKKINSYLTESESAQLTDLLCSMNLYFDTNMSVYDSIKTLLNICDTEHKTNKLFYSTEFIELSNLLAQILRNVPPIYIFLDSVDLEFEHAPFHWLLCQKGLFYAVMNLLEESDFGERLHVIVCVRDVVFTNILRSEHASKFAKEDHIFLLIWNEDNIRDFIKQKVQKLPDCYFNSDISKIAPSDRLINDWLDVASLEVNNVKKSVTDFIINHSRLVPRDIINLLNSLSSLKLEKCNDPTIQVNEWIINKIIADSAIIGGEMITTCAKSIMANGLPIKAGQDDYSLFYYADEQYKESTYSKLSEILKSIDGQTFGAEFLKRIEDKANEVFENDVHILDTLWNCGILGYIDANDKANYYAQDFKGDTLLPRKKEQYIIHTCVIMKLEKL